MGAVIVILVFYSVYLTMKFDSLRSRIFILENKLDDSRQFNNDIWDMCLSFERKIIKETNENNLNVVSVYDFREFTKELRQKISCTPTK
jgi:cell division protein FtsL